MADDLRLANHEFLPEDPGQEYGHDTRYRWVLDNHGYVHFGLVPDYSHWDILRQMDTQAPDVDAMGFYSPSNDKVSVSESYTYDDIPVIAQKVRDTFTELVMKTSSSDIIISDLDAGEAFFNWQGKRYVFDPSFLGKERRGFNAYDRKGDLVGSATYTINADHIYLESMYVDPAYRGEGVATQLLEAIRQYHPAYPLTGDWNPHSPMNHISDEYNQLVGKVAANGWRKWIYDPETDDYQEWEGPQPHPLIAQMVWPDKDLSQGNWWGGSRYIGSHSSVPIDYHAEVYYAPPNVAGNHNPGQMNTKTQLPDFVLEHMRKTAADNYFYIKSWMRPLTRWLYFPNQHILFARPFHDVFYTTHMQMFADVIKHYPNLENEPMEGGYVTSIGQVNITMGEAANLEALGQALRAYNLEGQTAPLPH